MADLSDADVGLLSDADVGLTANGAPPPIRSRDWMHSREIGAVSNILGTPRGAADLQRGAIEGLTGSKTLGTVANLINPVTLFGQYAPSGGQIKDWIYRNSGLPETNTPGAAGPAIDAGTETAMSAIPGGPRALLPAFTGGAAQQVAGDIPGIKGTKWEPFVRLGAGTLFGGLAAGLQNGAESVGHGISNAFGGGNPADRAGSIIARGLNRDQMTFGDLAAGAEKLPEGAPPVIAGGENTRAALRGSTVKPGEARTITNSAFENYNEGAPARVGSAIDEHVSNLPPIQTRINTLENERAAASRPAYEAAGIPPRIEKTETTVPGEPVQKMVPAMPGFRPGVMKQTPVLEPGEPVVQKTFNTPNVSSPALDALLRDSKDVQAAIGAARRLPDFKELPANSMAMLDKAYKHLNGMEQEAIRGGNGTRAYDIGNVRKDFLKAVTEANPAYGKALAAYSEPSKLIDAANSGRDWFAKNVPPDQVGREWAAMPPEQKKEALGGIADWLRTKIGGTDRASPAERVFNSQNVRDRLKTVLEPGAYNKLEAIVEQEKQGAQTARAVTQGSRTTPMAAEGEDVNAGAMLGVIHKVMDGHYGLAALDLVKTGAKPFISRITEGRNAAVNSEIARTLTDPERLAAMRAQIEQAQQQAALRQAGRQNALTYGALAPAMTGISK